MTERAVTEIAGKLRLLSRCGVCLRNLENAHISINCSHYFCEGCLKKNNVSASTCPQCEKESPIRKASYLDNTLEEMLKIRDLLYKKPIQEKTPTATKRKADNDDCSTPTTKNLKTNRAASTLSQSPLVFGKKSVPALAPSRSATVEETQLSGFSEMVSEVPAVRDPQRTLLQNREANGNLSQPISKKADSIPPEIVGSQKTITPISPSTLDSPPSTEKTPKGTSVRLEAPSVREFRTIEIQTEREYIPVKRYYDAGVQTESFHSCCIHDTVDGCRNLPSLHNEAAQSAQSELSPVKATQRDQSEVAVPAPGVDSLDDVEFPSEKLPDKDETRASQSEAVNSVIEIPQVSSETHEKDSLDSFEFKTAEIDKGITTESKTVQSDSLDSLPSQVFRNPAKQKPSQQKKQKETLDSYFKSSDEVGSIPETQPPRSSPPPVPKAATDSDTESPFQVTEKRKILILSDDESQKEASRRTPKKSQKKANKTKKRVASFMDSSDDDDPLPMDTEDMMNLEKEIENLDREMEDSRSLHRKR